MRKAFAFAGVAMTLALSATTAAWAGGNVAARCGNFGCDHIRCDHSGDHCVRYSDYDQRYNGYVNGYDNSYGGYYGGYGAPYDNGYYGGNGYNGNYPGPYDNGYSRGYSGGYYGGYPGGHLVCDNAGSRCYPSDGPYWNYRDYYRFHGYHWDR